MQLVLDLGEGGTGMLGEHDAGEALTPDVLDDVRRKAMRPVMRWVRYPQLPAQG